MITLNIAPYSADHKAEVIADFEECLRHSSLCYSMQHLILAGISSEEQFHLALDKSIDICKYAGINIADHFRQIYVFDTDSQTMYIDWIMSKKAFKLILLQYPMINEQIATMDMADRCLIFRFILHYHLR